MAEEFRPLIATIAARHYVDAALIDVLVCETLRRACAYDGHSVTGCPLSVWVAGVAAAVCDDLLRDPDAHSDAHGKRWRAAA